MVMTTVSRVPQNLFTRRLFRSKARGVPRLYGTYRSDNLKLPLVLVKMIRPRSRVQLSQLIDRKTQRVSKALNATTPNTRPE